MFSSLGFMDFNSIRLVRQQLLETACCPLRPEGYLDKTDAKMTFDPGGSQGRLRACPVLGSWRALLCGEVIRAGAAGRRAAAFFRGRFAGVFQARPVWEIPCKNKIPTVEGGSR